jgi:hypothetical protein
MAELVRDAGHQWRFRPNDDEICIDRAGEPEQSLAVLCAHRVAAAELGDSRIPGRCVQFVEVGGLAELPGERMLTSARPDQEYSHGRDCNEPV